MEAALFLFLFLFLLFLFLLGGGDNQRVGVVLGVGLELVVRVEIDLKNLVLEAAVGIVHEVVDDLVVVLVGGGVGDVEVELHVVGATLEETDALVGLGELACIGDKLLDLLAVHAALDACMLCLWQWVGVTDELLAGNDGDGVVDVDVVVAEHGEVIP